MAKKARVEVATSQTAERYSAAGRGPKLAKARAANALKRQKRAASAITRAKAFAKGKIAAAEARLNEDEALETQSKVQQQGSVLMHFYTTAEQEAVLDKAYNIKLREKEATGGSRKYSAAFYLRPPPRVFHVYDGRAFLQCATRNQATPAAAAAGGKTYTFDPTFSKEITEFCSRHSDGYQVVFGSDRNMSGGYGPGLPAQLVAASGETLSAEDPDAWGLVCG